MFLPWRVSFIDTNNQRIQVLKKDGTHVLTFGTAGTRGCGNDEFNQPYGVCVESGPSGHVYIADSNNNRIQILSKDGQYVRTLVLGADHRPFHKPSSVYVEPGIDKHVYVSDTHGRPRSRVVVLTKTGAHVRTIGELGDIWQLNQPEGVVATPGPDGSVWVADSGNHRVLAFLKKG